MSDPLHKRMFRKWGKHKCKYAWQLNQDGKSLERIRMRLWPYLDGGTTKSVKAMIAGWEEYLECN